MGRRAKGSTAARDARLVTGRLGPRRLAAGNGAERDCPMVTKYVCGRDWETPHVVELKFDEEGDLLVAPIGHRKKARYHLGGHYFTHKSDSTLSDTRNEAIDAAI